MDDPVIQPYSVGLASLKAEAMSSIYDDPSIKPWDGCGKEFDAYFKKEYESKFYYKPFLFILKMITANAWDEALLINAKKESQETK